MKSIIVTGGVDFITQFQPPIELDGDYSASLINLETYHSFPNVKTGENDTFKYFDGINWKTLTLPEGSHDLSNLQRLIQRGMADEGDGPTRTDPLDPIIFIPDNSTGSLEMEIRRDLFRVDFNRPSIGSLLGFVANIYDKGRHVSQNSVSLIQVNSVVVHCDLVGESYMDGKPASAIYSFYPAVEHGCKIIETPFNLVWLPVTKTPTINSIRVWLTDEKMKLLNLRGEKVSVRFALMKKNNGFQ